MKKKYLVILIDGMADYSLSELDGKTPLEEAETPALDRIAPEAKIGLVKTVPDNFPPGSDVANLSVLGYNPDRYYTGRSPYEALSIGVNLNEKDVIFRCNLVTLSENKKFKDRVMKDYSAGEISTEEAKELILECQDKLGNENLNFYPGVSYRHVLVWEQGKKDIQLTPPHDILEQRVTDYLPQGEGSEKLLKLMKKSVNFLPEHSVNSNRKKQNLPPANSIWLWGQGTQPDLPDFKDKFSVSGSVISAVDLVKGLGIAAGLKPIKVPGVTGRIDTNFRGKAETALKRFKKGDDFVFLHVEAADEASHQGDVDTKIKAIEKVDNLVLEYILNKMDSNNDDYSIMVLPDHYTPLCERTHVSDPVPFMIYRNYKKYNETGINSFSEKEAEKSDIFIKQGHKLINCFFDYHLLN